MKVLELKLSEVKVNPDLRTRSGEPDKKKIRQFLESMVRRHERDQHPQIQPVTVRPGDKEDTYILVDGENRLVALKEFNAMQKKSGGEEVPLLAVVERDDEKEAVETAVIANAATAPLTIFDKAAGMLVLESQGRLQEDIAKMYGCTPSYVSDVLRVGKLPQKIKAKVLSGTLSEEGAIAIARYNKDPQVQDKVLELAVSNRETMDKIEEKAELRQQKEQERATAAAEAGGKVKTLPAKKNGKKAPKGKTTAADVKEAAEQVGAKPKKKGGTKEPAKYKTYKQFFTFLESNFGGDVKEEVPEPIAALVGRLEGWFEGDYTDAQLKNSFEKNCRERYPATRTSAA